MEQSLARLFEDNPDLARAFRAAWPAGAVAGVVDRAGRVILAIPPDQHARVVQATEVIWPRVVASAASPHEVRADQPLCQASGHAAAVIRSRGGLDGAIIAVDGSAASGALALCAKLLGKLQWATTELDELAEALREAYDQLVFMYSISQAMASSAEHEDLVLAILRETLGVLRAERGVLAIGPGDTGPRFGVPAAAVDEPLLARLLPAVRDSQQPVLANNLPPEDQARCALLAPVWIGSELAATIGIFDKVGPAGFDSGDRKLLVAVAEQVAAVLQGARLRAELVERQRLDQELKIAAEIQMSLLPRQIPDLPGLDVAACCQPARQVGGDFYDLLPHRRGRTHGSPLLGVLVADVSGKGVPAALLLSSVRAVTRASATRGLEPRRLLEELNHSLYGELSNVGMFVTALAATVDPAECVLRVANAGHPPLLVWRSHAAQVEQVPASAPPIGVLDTIRLEEATVEIAPGDVVLACSDGLLEAPNAAGDRFGVERVVEAVRASATIPAADLLESLLVALARFRAGEPPADDVTLVVVKVGGGGAA